MKTFHAFFTSRVAHCASLRQKQTEASYMWLGSGRMGQSVIATDDWVRFMGAFRQRLSAILALSPRIERQVARGLRFRFCGGIKNNGTAMQTQILSARLQIVCCARRLHPWDEDLPEEKQSQLFTKQCLEDVDKGITRLFQQLPAVDEVDLTVVTPDGAAKILAGVVHRGDLLHADQSSVGMRLLSKGLNYHLQGYRLEPLP
jgi:hypothetical protein